MKVLDPQAALLTNLEVHHFLESNPPRKPDKKSGAYEPVNLQDYYNVRKDFKSYIDRITPHIKQYPDPDPFVRKVVQRLKKYELTKVEVLNIVNLGLGMSRSQLTNISAPQTLPEVVENDAGGAKAEVDANAIASEDQEAEVEDGNDEPDYRALAQCVIDSFTDRFPGDEGEEKIQSILAVIDECISEAKLA